ncbi:MAG: pyridoxal phosphate-dependent aminotransferase [Candidatus Levyibacteriota bacterium]
MISNRARQIKPSGTIAVTTKANEMKKEGIDVVSFGAGEPDFDTPENIKKAAIDAINSGFTKYTASSGIPELKKAICEKFRNDNGLEYTPANILVGNGAKQCLYDIFQALLNPGDEVIIPVPYWVSYEEQVKLADGVCVFLQAQENFKITAEQINNAITSKTKALIICSPNNPTGTVYTQEELEAIAKVCVEKNIYVISDEIYEKLIYGGQEPVSIASLNPEIKKLTIIVNGVSKTYAMTGWRIGYCVAPEDVIKAASALQDHSTGNPNSIAQKAALEGLTGPQETVAAMKKEFEKRRDYMIDRLNKMKNISCQKPDGAFYAFPDVSKTYGNTVHNSLEFCSKLLDEEKVAIVPGSAFGDDNCVRLSYATSMENIVKGLDRLEAFVNKL